MPKVRKVTAPSMPVNTTENAPKKRGRPKGSKNKVTKKAPVSVVPTKSVTRKPPVTPDGEPRKYTYKADKCGCKITTGMRVIDISCEHRNFMKLVK
jgi:hypothetical protein